MLLLLIGTNQYPVKLSCSSEIHPGSASFHIQQRNRSRKPRSTEVPGSTREQFASPPSTWAHHGTLRILLEPKAPVCFFYIQYWAELSWTKLGRDLITALICSHGCFRHSLQKLMRAREITGEGTCCQTWWWMQGPASTSCSLTSTYRHSRVPMGHACVHTISN